MSSSRFTSKFKTKIFKKGTRFAFFTALAVIIVILINILSSLIPAKYRRFDTTGQGLFTISKQTEDILHTLSEDISIYHLCTGGIEDENISELLLKYASFSDKLSVSVIDTSLYPNFYQDFTDEEPSDNSIIVSGDRRYRVIDFYEIYTASSDEYAYYGYYDIFNGETELTSAIDYVTSDILPKIYTLEGHSEYTLSDELQKEILKQNFDLETLSLNGLTSVPEDADCIMLLSPKRDITDKELAMLTEYENNGGKLVITADYNTEDTPVFDKLLGNFGLEIADGIVFEEDSKNHVSSYPYFIYPTIIPHEITDPLISENLHLLFPLALGIKTKNDADTSLNIEQLIAPSETSYSKIDINSDNLSKTDDDIEGPFSFGVAVTGNEDDEGRLIMFSTTEFLDSSVNKSVAGANYDLFINSIAWLCSKESGIALRPKNLLPTSVAVSSGSASIMFVLLVIAIPGIFIAAAFLIIRRRRLK